MFLTHNAFPPSCIAINRDVLTRTRAVLVCYLDWRFRRLQQRAHRQAKRCSAERGGDRDGIPLLQVRQRERRRHRLSTTSVSYLEQAVICFLVFSLLHLWGGCCRLHKRKRPNLILVSCLEYVFRPPLELCGGSLPPDAAQLHPVLPLLLLLLLLLLYRRRSVSLDIIGKAIFNYEFGSVTKESPVIQSVYSVLKEAEHRSTTPAPYWQLPLANQVNERRSGGVVLLTGSLSCPVLRQQQIQSALC